MKLCPPPAMRRSQPVLSRRSAAGSCSRNLRSLLPNQGFTLVEVMIAAMVLLVAMAGIVPFFIGGLNHSTTLRYKSLATNVARERMEEIRQLDYREITGPTELATRFGSSATERGIDFQVSYDVQESSYDSGILKKVTVNVGWAAPPKVSAAAITTMIHQQFLGPRGALLEVTPFSPDPLGTPFPAIGALGNEGPPVSSPTWARYHLAQADWGLVFNNLDQPGMTARNVYARLVFFNDQGGSIPVGDSGNDYKIDNSNLRYTTGEDGKVNDAWFEYLFDASAIPDGYWELRAIAYNEYDQPGNVWRLRTRIENGPPAIPTQFVATPQADNQSMVLTWQGGLEQDRDHYVLERRKWVDGGWTEWIQLSNDLAPNSATYTDVGILNVQDPWGTPDTPNQYEYQLWALDICNPAKPGSAAVTDAQIPPQEGTTTTSASTTTTAPTTTTSTSSTTTTLASYSVQIKNSTNKSYSLDIKDSGGSTAYSGSVGKNSTITVSDLDADNYLITAMASGRPTITQSFSVPAQAGQIVLNIL